MRRRVVLLALVGVLCLVGMVASPPASAVVYCEDYQGQYCDNVFIHLNCTWRSTGTQSFCLCDAFMWNCLQPPG